MKPRTTWREIKKTEERWNNERRGGRDTRQFAKILKLKKCAGCQRVFMAPAWKISKL
jgi:hypothetical protein